MVIRFFTNKQRKRALEFSRRVQRDERSPGRPASQLKRPVAVSRRISGPRGAFRKAWEKRRQPKRWPVELPVLAKRAVGRPANASMILHAGIVVLVGWLFGMLFDREEGRPVPEFSIATLAPIDRRERPATLEAQPPEVFEPVPVLPEDTLVENRFEPRPVKPLLDRRAFKKPYKPVEVAPPVKLVSGARQGGRIVTTRGPRSITQYSPMPVFPQSVARRFMQSEVRVGTKVTREGHVESTWLDESSGIDELDILAVSAVKRWRFEPALRQDVPVDGQAVVTVYFAIPSDS